MRELLVVLPTRNRPQNVIQFLDAFERTRTWADLAVVADEDDPGTLARLQPPWADWLDVLVLPRSSTATKVNAAALPGSKTHRAVMFLGDDNVCRTEGWDEQIIEALETPWDYERTGPPGSGFVYVNDLGGREEIIACNMVISSDIIDALGYFDQPSMNHFRVDNVWQDIARATTGLTYLPDVIIEHLHPVLGKGRNDQLYGETWNKWWYSDLDAYERWEREDKANDIQRVLERLGVSA